MSAGPFTELLYTFAGHGHRDVLPIALTIFGFQLLVLRKPIPGSVVLWRDVYVLVGLAFFLEGLPSWHCSPAS